MMNFIENSHLYNMHEMHHAAMAPISTFMGAVKDMHRNPLMPLAYTGFGKSIAAAAEVMERITDRYHKPTFGLTETVINGKTVAVEEEVILEKPFCRLLHFKRDTKKNDSRLLIVAPMSGHHSTLLRGTVTAMLPDADIYITDWLDARDVSMMHGDFSLDDYIAYIIEFAKTLGRDTHMMAVCQPSVPVLAAASIMAARKDADVPRSITLIGGPVDTREGPTKVTEFSKNHSLSWFESNVITRVPFQYKGFMRRVYPGFLQLSGFMSMNWQRHVDEHVNLFKHLVTGDGDSAAMHRKFYDEYLSVADLPGEFYLQTIDRVFQRHLLPKGELMYGDQRVDPSAITKTALLTIEGELDDISGVGQTKAAHKLVKNLPAAKQKYHLQKAVGHYGLFNGKRFREIIRPVILEFMKKNG